MGINFVSNNLIMTILDVSLYVLCSFCPAIVFYEPKVENMFTDNIGFVLCCYFGIL